VVTPWHTGRLACFDLETSGISAHHDRIVTAAVILVGNGQPPVTHEWLLQPTIPIPQGATDVHGISDEFAREHGTDPAKGVTEIATVLLEATAAGVPVVGHNVGVYDLTMLVAELVRHGQPAMAEQVAAITPVIDTLVIEKHLDAFRPGKPNGRRPDDACGPHTLMECCRLWGVTLTEEDAHGATADALAAGRLAWRLATDPHRFAQFDKRPTDRIRPADWPLEQLHEWQRETRRAQADSFGAYLVKQGKPDDVSRDWPVQPFPEGWDPSQTPAVIDHREVA
jgi:DNA polymerase-3 subunit epsilon